MKDIITKDKNGQLVTGGCCQWRGSASYDSVAHIETFVLRRKFSDEPPNSTPPERWLQLDEKIEKEPADVHQERTTRRRSTNNQRKKTSSSQQNVNAMQRVDFEQYLVFLSSKSKHSVNTGRWLQSPLYRTIDFLS